MSASKKFSSGCCCKRASSIGSGSSSGSGGGSDGLWTLINGKVSTILDRAVRVENTISSVVLEIDSDKRLKTDIESIDTTCVDSLFNNVSPKKFAYKKTPDDTHYGFIAQDIKNAGNGLEHIVSQSICVEGFYSIRMLEIIPFLFAKIKQLEERIEQMENK